MFIARGKLGSLWWKIWWKTYRFSPAIFPIATIHNISSLISFIASIHSILQRKFPSWKIHWENHFILILLLNENEKIFSCDFINNLGNEANQEKFIRVIKMNGSKNKYEITIVWCNLKFSSRISIDSKLERIRIKQKK